MTRFAIDWRAAPWCAIHHEGLYLLHCEAAGIPHCVANGAANDGKKSEVLHGDEKFSLTSAHLQANAAVSVGTKLQGTFRLAPAGELRLPMEDEPMVYEILNGFTDLVAAARASKLPVGGGGMRSNDIRVQGEVTARSRQVLV